MSVNLEHGDEMQFIESTNANVTPAEPPRLLLHPVACDRCESPLKDQEAMTLWIPVAYVQLGTCLCRSCEQQLEAMSFGERIDAILAATVRRGERQSPEWGQAVELLLGMKILEMRRVEAERDELMRSTTSGSLH